LIIRLLCSCELGTAAGAAGDSVLRGTRAGAARGLEPGRSI